MIEIQQCDKTPNFSAVDMIPPAVFQAYGLALELYDNTGLTIQQDRPGLYYLMKVSKQCPSLLSNSKAWKPKDVQDTYFTFFMLLDNLSGQSLAQSLSRGEGILI